MILQGTPLPGLEQVRNRFLDLLKERTRSVSALSHAAQEATSPSDIRQNLYDAQMILHQIAGSAGSLGFAHLGDLARGCENVIVSHLQDKPGHLREGLTEIIDDLNRFVMTSQDVQTKSEAA